MVLVGGRGGGDIEVDHKNLLVYKLAQPLWAAAGTAWLCWPSTTLTMSVGQGHVATVRHVALVLISQAGPCQCRHDV